MRHLFDIEDIGPDDWENLLAAADRVASSRVLDGQGVALLFEKPSVRTRNSTEMAVVDLGGHPVSIQGTEVGLDSREAAEDVARTLACYHRIICARVFDHGVLVRMAAALERSGFEVPVVNLLSDRAHPCQAVADILTLREALGGLSGRALTFVGDANNVARSLAKAAMLEGMEFRMAAPEGFAFSVDDLAELEGWAEKAGRGGTVRQVHDPLRAAAGAAALYTDVWTSMGQEGERGDRLAAFAGYTVDEALVAEAAPEVVVLHCLPAHRGEEIAEAVLEGPRAAVWRQAAYRRVAMRGVLSWVIEDPS